MALHAGHSGRERVALTMTMRGQFSPNDDYDMSPGVMLTISAETIHQARLEVELDDLTDQRPNDFALIVANAIPWPERKRVWTPPEPRPRPTYAQRPSFWDRLSLWRGVR